MSRHERQRAEILRSERDGQHARVLVLSREHLAEFPDDSQVRAAAERAAARATTVAPQPPTDPEG